MHKLQAQQYLLGDDPSPDLIDLSRVCRFSKIGFKITILEVFHGEKEVTSVLKPTKKLDEQILLFALLPVRGIGTVLQVCSHHLPVAGRIPAAHQALLGIRCD